jgi:hypothetical protein
MGLLYPFTIIMKHCFKTKISSVLVCAVREINAHCFQKFGKPVETTDRRMTGERCGHLCAVAIANRLDEAWMALPPTIAFIQFFIYFPNVGSL